MLTKKKLRRAAKAALARHDLLYFTKHTFPAYQVNWHHKLLCEKLTQFANGEIKRLMVFMPPRSGKSELVSRRLPAYALGRNPDCKVIAASYGDVLARAMNRDVQRIIDTDEYREIFPNTTLNGSNVRAKAEGNALRNTDEFEIVGHKGSYKSAGVGGGLTGRGFNIGIIDDPVKDREQADSAVYREKVWDWYTSVFYTRQEKDASILLTVTRWHEDDLAGRIIRQQEETGEEWEILTFPMIKEDEDDNPEDPREIGEPLWPDKYSLEQCETMKRTMGTRDWEALEQQRPSPEGGNVIKREWFKYYDMDDLNVRPDDEPPTSLDKLTIFNTVDLAASLKEHADYFVCGTWGIGPGRLLYLLDIFRDRIGGERIKPVLRSIKNRWKSGAQWIEKVGMQLAVIQQCKAAGLPVREFEPIGDKLARAYAATPFMEQGKVYFPRNAPWLGTFENEILVFPAGAHDDQLDVLTMGIAVYDQLMYANTVTPRTGVTHSPRKNVKELVYGQGTPRKEQRKGRRNDRKSKPKSQW